MIKIDHTIKEPSSLGFLYSPADECLGEIENELQLYDVQIQICRENAAGYYIIWNNKKIDIIQNGELTSWPNNWCDQSQGAFVELQRARMTKLGKESPIPHEADRSWRHSDELSR